MLPRVLPTIYCTVIGTSTHPTTAISVSNLTPNNNYNYYLVAKNAFGNSIIKGVVSLLTLPLSPVIELLSVTSTTATINVVNFGTSLSVSNSLTVYPSTGVSVTNNGPLYTVTGLMSSSNYFIGTVTSNTAGYANTTLGQLTNTSALIPVAATTNVPAISAFGQYICVGCYGNGIYVSNNYGATFTQIVSEANASQSAISDSGRYMYVACNNVGRLYCSNNYGTSFVQVVLGANISCITCSILGNNVFASDATNGGFYYSTNYGVNWSSLITTCPQATSIKTNFAGTVTFLTSTSNGKAYSYNLLTNTVTAYSPGGGSNVSSVAASAEGQYIYLTNYGGFCYVSNNAGASFAAISTTYLPSANYASVVCDTTGQYVYLHNGTTTLYYSSNYGTTFSSTAMNTAINNLYLNSNANYLTMSSGSGIYISTASFLLTVPPAPPTNLVDISNTVSTALVSFTPTSGNLAITGYTALTNPFGGVGTGTPSAYTLNNLLINTNYTVAIAASNSGGTSGFSDSLSFATLSGGTPSPLTPYWTPNYSNIVSYFKFDDASGSTTVVESIAGNNGTTQAGVTFGNGGIANTCAAFNGNNQYITVPYQVLNNLAAGTILCWIYPLALNNMTIFVKQRDGSNTYSALTIGTYPSTGGVQTVGTPGTVYFHSKNSQTVAAAASTTLLTTNTWYHIGVTFNASTINIYINGQLDSSTATNGSIPAEAAPTSTTIGGWYASGTLISRFKGYMDDLSVWNIAQTPTNIATIYATQLNGTGSSRYVQPFPFVLDASFGALVQAANSSSYYINSGYSKGSGFNYTSFPNWNINYANASVAMANGSNAFFTAAMPPGTTQAFVFQVNGNYPTQSYGVLSQMVFINAVGNYTLNFSTIPTALTDPSYISLTAMIGGYSTSATLLNSNTSWNNVIMPFTAASIGNYNLLFYFLLSPNYLNVAVNSAISLTAVGITPAFTVPTNLSLTGVTSTTASLTFTGAATSGISATSYSSNIGTGTGSPSAYTITGLPGNTNNVIYLVANYPAGFYSTGTSLGGPSLPSLPIAVFTAPAAPVLTYVSSTISTITISIVNSGPGTITGYSVVTVPNSGPVTTSGPNSAYVLSGLLSNTVYTLNLAAINSAGTSPNGTLTVTTVPSAPTSVTGTVLNDSMVSVGFTAPSGGGVITQYTVTSSPGNVVTTGTTSPITVNGLNANTAYTFTVTATNTAGTSAASDPSTAVTTNPVPNTPTNLAVTATTGSSVTVSFTAPTGVINGYIVSTSAGAQATGTSSPITINGLASSTTYTISAVSVNYNGTSAASSSINGTTGAGSLFSNNGSSLTGWTLGANACSINASIGNPAPSIAASGTNASYAFYNLGQSFLNTTITFDVYVGSLCNFYFACNSTGAGQMFRAEGRGTGSGFASTSSWTNWNAPPGGIRFVPGTWYSAKVVISSSGVASWYQNNVLQSQTYTIANNGTYFGLQGDGGGGISYFDNILITFGPTGGGGTGSSVATNFGTLLQPVVTSTSATVSAATVTFTAPTGAASGTTYSIVSGGTTYGSASYPATTITASGLTSNTTYAFNLTATNANGTSIPSTLIRVTTQILPPTINSTSAIAFTSATINFTAPSGAASGTTYAASAGGITYGTAAYPATSIFDTSLNPNTVYSFTLTATNATSTSAASSPTSITTLPGPPTNVVGTALNDTAVSLSFTPPTGTAAISTYTVTNLNNGSTTTGLSTPITVTGLAANTTYSFVISATNVTGTSPISSSVSVTTNAVPNSPTGLTLVSSTPVSATVSFTLPSGTINYYTLRTNSGAVVTGLTSPLTLYGLSPNTPYSITAQAVDGAGASAPSSSLSVTTPAISTGAVLAAPTIGSVSSITTTTAVLGFTPPAGATTGTSYTAYTGATPYGASAYPATTIYLSGMQPNTSYLFSVVATNQNGSSNPSGTVALVTVPLAPTGLAIVTKTSTSAYIGFNTVSGNATLVGYNAVDASGIYTGTNTTSPIVVNGLNPATTYTFTVTGTNSATQTSAPSSTVSVTTLLAAPTITSASSIGTNTATLNFTAPTGSALGPTYSAGAGGNNYGSASYPATSIPLTGLSPNTTYSFNIKATNANGTSPASNAQLVTTVPGPPTNISFNVVSDSAVYVGFTAPTGTAAVTNYTVTTSPGNLTFSGPATPILVTALLPNTTYTFTVTATNGQGTSVPSISSNPCLTDMVPKCPVNITLTATTATSITVTFSPPTGTVLSYIISTSSGITSYSLSSPITLGGLSPSTTYTVSLYSVGSLGTSLPSPTFTVTTPTLYSYNGSLILAAPTITGATSVTSTTMVLNFTAPTGNTTGVTYSAVSGSTNLGSTAYPNTSVLLSSLSPNTVYNVSMTTSNNYGTSTASIPLSVTTLPNPPTGLTLISVNSNSVTLSFTAPSGTVALAYTSSVGSGSGSPSSFVITGLTGATTYSLSILATNVTGSATSLPITVTTALLPPTNLNARSVTSTGATVNFTPPTGITTAASYTLYLAGQLVGTLNYPSTSFVLTGLLSNTVYSFTITVTNTGQTSSPSNILYVTTLPIPPTSVTVVGATSSSVSVSMDQPTGNAALLYVASIGTTSGTYNNLSISGLLSNTPYSFTIALQNSSGSATSQTLTAITSLAAPTSLALSSASVSGATISFVPPPGVSSGTTYAIYNGATVVGSASYPSSTIVASGLTANTAYTLTMTATNANGSSPVSAGVAVSTLPNPPTSVAATVLTDTYVNVAFTASTGPLAITGYTVTSSPGSVTATGASSPILVTGLSANTAYTFTVTATAAQGTSVPSVASSSVTTNAVPNPPTGLTGTSNTNSSISLSFTAPYGNISSYNYRAVDSSGNVFTGNFAAPATTLTISGLGLGRTYTTTLQSVDAFGTSVASSPLVYATQSYTIVTTSLIINLDSTLGVSGSTWTDQTGNGYNYTFYNSSQTVTNYTTATSNGLQAISLSGSNYMWRANSTGFNPYFVNSYTFEMWVYPKTKVNATLIYENGQNSFGGWSDDLMGINSSGYFTSQVYNGGKIINTSGGAYVLNTWYQVVNVYDDSARILYQYVNGALKAQVNIARSKPGTMWLVLGAQAGNGSSYMNGLGYFNGYIGAFRGYNIALNATQILQNYNAYKTTRYY